MALADVGHGAPRPASLALRRVGFGGTAAPQAAEAGALGKAV